jgi:hypothetical protein
VAEQLALQELARNRGAIDGHERFAPAMAVLMNGAGDELLPRAGLARDQHGRVAVGEHADRLLHGAHGLARPDQPVLVRLGARLARLAPDRKHSSEGARHILAADRFRQMIEGAEPHRLDRVRRGRMGGQYRDWRGIRSRADAPQDLEAVHAGHAKVEQDGVDGVRSQKVYGLRTASGKLGVITEVARGFAERLAHRRVVVDDQDGRHGITISKVVPA